MRPARLPGVLAALLVTALAAGASGQRMQFGTQLTGEAATPGGAAPGSPYPGSSPSGAAGSATQSPAPGPVAPAPQPGEWTAPPGSTDIGPQPYHPLPGDTMIGPQPGYPAPGATQLEGSIQPVPPGFDPYRTTTPEMQPLFPEGPNWDPFSYDAVGTARRFLDKVRLEYTWIAPDGSQPFGVNSVDLNASFAFPLFYQQDTPLYVTPGFAVHFWEGPKVEPAALPYTADLPPQAFDAYLDVTWNPVLGNWLRAELGARVGVYSDFSKVNTDSLRFMGSGLAVLPLTPNADIKFGIVYLDRNRIKLLPAGGLVWAPNADTRFEFLFPNPKFTQRLYTFGNTQWWWYVLGEYGGGSWTVERAAGFADSVDYNDIRVAVGLEFLRPRGLGGFFEVGISFDREIVYVVTPMQYEPSTTMFLRGGISY